MNEATQEFINFIKELGDGLTEFLTTPYGKLRIVRIPQATYYRKVGKFQTAGLITKSAGSSMALTRKALQLLQKPTRKRQRTDGNSTIIIFDIPIDKNRERGIFRRYLIRNGYTLLQKSVFISPDVMSEEIKELITELKIRKCISVIAGKLDYF